MEISIQEAELYSYRSSESIIIGSESVCLGSESIITSSEPVYRGSKSIKRSFRAFPFKISLYFLAHLCVP